MPRGRLVQNNATVFDQADFFQSDGFTRVTGLTPVQLTSAIFFNNVLQPWPLASGAAITDVQVASGHVYFNEIPAAPGYYNVRFRPNAVGYWRLVLVYTVGQQIVVQDYDVVSREMVDVGLNASFIRPRC